MTSSGTSCGNTDVTVVVDLGSGCVKAGIAGEEVPRCVIPSVVPSLSDKTETRIGLGENRLSARGIQEARCPIERGHIRDFDDLESLLQTVYSQLDLPPDSKLSTVFTRPMFCPEADESRLVELAFEKFRTTAVYLARQPVLTMYASGRTDGMVVDVGDGLTQVLPVYGGYAVTPAAQRQNIAGCDVTQAVQTQLNIRQKCHTHVDLQTAQKIKESLCCVTCNPYVDTEENTPDVTKSYTLPNGEIISVESERFRCPEILFNPSLIGSESLGLSKLVHQALTACSIDVRGQLSDKIIMSGGTTLLRGICKRLLTDLTTLAPSVHWKLFAPTQRHLCVWKGGSVLGSLSTFHQLCVTQEEFKDQGSRALKAKFT